MTNNARVYDCAAARITLAARLSRFSPERRRPAARDCWLLQPEIGAGSEAKASRVFWSGRASLRRIHDPVTGRQRNPRAKSTVTVSNGALAKTRVKESERCQSGRMGLTRNQVYGLPYRGFESHPLRQTVRPSSSLRSETVEGLFLSGGYVTLSGTFPDRTKALRPE